VTGRWTGHGLSTTGASGQWQQLCVVWAGFGAFVEVKHLFSTTPEAKGGH
jgi:hypothetical protein